MGIYFLLAQTDTYQQNPQLQTTGPNATSDSIQKMVEARLHLPISRRLLDQNIELPIIRRCWEDQLLHKSENEIRFSM